MKKHFKKHLVKIGLGVFIDGTSAGSTTATTSFSKMAMGDWWGDTHAGTNYYDDVEIQQN